MERIFKDYLFSKHILVCEKGEDPNAFETLFAIANMFNIRIKEGQILAERNMIEYISSMVGVNVPEPFYKGFPESVKKLSKDELLFDQMVQYTVTYGFGNFSQAGHSLLEEQFERTAFKEDAEIKDFIIVNEADAVQKLKESVYDLFTGTRPLNPVQYSAVSHALDIYDIKPEKCASKNLALRLLTEKRDLYFAKFLALPDVIKLTEDINYRLYKNINIKKLNLKNQDRKLITSVIDIMFIRYTKNRGKDFEKDVKSCFERKALWSGLLHHIHYKPVNGIAKEFTDLMRGNTNDSVYSAFEKEIANGNIAEAVSVLKEGKDLTLCAYGTMINHVLDAADLLRAQGIDAEVLKLGRIKPINEDVILRSANKTGIFLFPEEANAYGNVFEPLLASVAGTGTSAKFFSLNLGDRFTTHGSMDKLYDAAGLSAERIAQTAARLFHETKGTT